MLGITIKIVILTFTAFVLNTTVFSFFYVLNLSLSDTFSSDPIPFCCSVFFFFFGYFSLLYLPSPDGVAP
jgi:hypothetical protein